MHIDANLMYTKVHNISHFTCNMAIFTENVLIYVHLTRCPNILGQKWSVFSDMY